MVGVSRSSSRAADQEWPEAAKPDRSAVEREWADRHRSRVAAETRAVLAGSRRSRSLRTLWKRWLS